MTNTKLTSIDVEQQDDGMYQVVATYSNGKSKAWSCLSMAHRGYSRAMLTRLARPLALSASAAPLF
jgi:hypothetical protein